MKCVICENEFVAKRADAKFCSSTCRSKGSRLEKVQMEEKPMVYVGNHFNAESVADVIEKIPAPAPEKEKKVSISESREDVSVSPGFPAPPEKEKKEYTTDGPNQEINVFLPLPEILTKKHCESCTELPTYGHFCPNKECGCFETKEEQEASLEALQRTCPHPKEEDFMSRCLSCGRIQLSTVKSGKHMSKELCPKHNGYKYQCGCKAKEE